MINKQLQNKVQNLEKFNDLQTQNDPIGMAEDRQEEMEKQVKDLQAQILQ